MLEKTDSEFAWLLPSSRFKVSISPTSRRQGGEAGDKATARSACKCDGHKLRSPRYLLYTLPG